MLDINIDSDELASFAKQYRADGPLMTAALRSTVSKMLRWTRTRSSKELSAALRIQQKVLRHRLKGSRLRVHGDGIEGALWHGLDPISMGYLSPRQTRSGVTTRAHKVKSAFIAEMDSTKVLVVKRRGKERLPIDRQDAPIDEKAMQALEGQVFNTREFEAQFYKTFEAEIKWRTNSV